MVKTLLGGALLPLLAVLYDSVWYSINAQQRLPRKQPLLCGPHALAGVIPLNSCGVRIGFGDSYGSLWISPTSAAASFAEIYARLAVGFAGSYAIFIDYSHQCGA